MLLLLSSHQEFHVDTLKKSSNYATTVQYKICTQLVEDTIVNKYYTNLMLGLDILIYAVYD